MDPISRIVFDNQVQALRGGPINTNHVFAAR
jgi:hypothetical protein